MMCLLSLKRVQPASSFDLVWAPAFSQVTRPVLEEQFFSLIIWWEWCESQRWKTVWPSPGDTRNHGKKEGYNSQNRTCIRSLQAVNLYIQWLFLVPLIGGRYRQLGDYMVPTTYWGNLETPLMHGNSVCAAGDLFGDEFRWPFQRVKRWPPWCHTCRCNRFLAIFARGSMRWTVYLPTWKP